MCANFGPRQEEQKSAVGGKAIVLEKWHRRSGCFDVSGAPSGTQKHRQLPIGMFVEPMAMQQEAKKMKVPTIYKAYFLGLCKGISPQNMAWKMVQYLHFRILEFPLMECGPKCQL